MSESATRARGVRKQRQGIVVSKSGNKTAVVQVEERKQHPLYGKVVRRYHKFHAHDPENTAQVGDQVRIVECRPVSRLKRWRVTDVLRSAGSKGEQG